MCVRFRTQCCHSEAAIDQQSHTQNGYVGSERLLMFVDETRELPIKEVLNRLEEQLRLWRGSIEFEDDISLLVLEMIADA